MKQSARSGAPWLALTLGLALLVQGSPVSAGPAARLETVYITKSGDKFHADGCRYLRRSKIPVSRSEALRMGKEACGVCKP